MNDNEKNRAEYVMHMENQVKHLQRQLGDLQAEARWIPQVNTEMDSQKDEVRITLAFGGKRCTATFLKANLGNSSVTDATTAVIDSFYKNLIGDRFRELVEPEIAHAITSVKAVEGAGKW